MPKSPLNVPGKACVVATGLGHRPYTRHRATIAGEPSITHCDLANDQPITMTRCLFDTTGDY